MGQASNDDLLHLEHKASSSTLVIQPFNFSNLCCEIPELRGDNYKVWKERILLHLGMKDLDYAIWNDEPQAITETSTPDEVALYKCWERSNRLSVMLIKATIYAGICGCVDQHENVRALLKAIDELFAPSDKALGITLLRKFSSMKFNGVRGVREHIMEMCHIAARLKPCGVEMAESVLVEHILNTLPEQYDLLKISYNIRKDKWSINELIAICAGEEERRLMQQGEGSDSEHGKNKAQAKHEGKGKIPAQADIKKEYKCFFCKKKGHVKQDCMKFHQWLEKKGIAVPKKTGGR